MSSKKAVSQPMVDNEGKIQGYAPMVTEGRKKHKMFVGTDDKIIILATKEEAIEYAKKRM